jgi:MFS family permease
MMMQATQLGVLLRDRGVGAAGISWLVALYAMMVLIGRILCGLSRDRWPTHLVVAVALSLPGLGLLTLATGVTHTAVLAGSLALLGLSMGSEVDIMSYLVMRYFGVEIFSTVIGLVGAAVALAASGGALILSLTLRISGAFTVFLILTGCASMLGGLSFLYLGRAEARRTTGYDPRSQTPLNLSPDDATPID